MGELYGMPYAHEFVPLIRRNSKLPATRTQVFFTMHEEQEAVEIKVYQGEDPDALKNVEIGTFRISGLNRQQGARDEGLLFTYSLDLDGLLHVHARERATGREIRGVVENALGRSTEEALGAARERVSALWGDEGAGGEATGGDAGEPMEEAAGGSAGRWPEEAARPVVPPEIRETLERAEKALDIAPAEDREEMVDLMEDLRDALKAGRLEQAAGVKKDLDEILFYLE